jgi:hypothetical protein
MAQDEHEQAIVLLAPEAHQLAADEDRDELAVQRAIEGFVLDALDAEIERRLPGAAEAFGAGLAAQMIGADLAHIDHAAGDLDRAGIGQRLDEGLLALGGPAVVAGLAGDRSEVRERRALIARNGGAVLHGDSDDNRIGSL